MKQKQMPSVGFWVLVALYTLVVSFFIWGGTTPRLDKVWELELKLKTGEIQRLSNSEKDLFYSVFEDYPEYLNEMAGSKGIDLLSANSDGLSVVDELLVVRSERAANCGRISLVTGGQSSEYPIVFNVSGRTWNKEVKAKQSGRSVVWLPKDVLVPELIEVTRKNRKGKAGAIDVKVRFCK